MKYRTTAVVLVGLLGLLVWPAAGEAQDETPANPYLDYGGVRIPLPPDNPTTPDVADPQMGGAPDSRAPGGESSGSAESGPRVRYGRGGSRSARDAEGVETSVYQSTRVAEVVHSSSRDRYSWFYSASELYRGIIPNIHDSLPHIAVHQRAGADPTRRNSVTWIGFQPFDHSTRVFVQLARSPSYTVNELEDGHLLEIQLQNTTLSLSNFTRFMNTSFFGRSVTMIDAEQLRDSVARVVISREELAPYTVTVDGEYLYVDFEDVRGR